MSKITTIDKQTCKDIREKLNPMIEKFMQDTFGLKAALGSASYTDKSVSFKLEIKAEGVASIFIQHAAMMGWPEIGTKFTYTRRQFEVVDYNPKKHSKPVICVEIGTDKRYLFSSDDIKKLAS